MLLLILATLAGAPGTEVKTASGLVSGVEVPGDPLVHAWKGIPYAAPPVGGLRWRPPQPPAPWDGVRPCAAFGPACPQPDLRGVLRGPARQDEDCLYLNVWAPAERGGAPRPVMVWIHGGGMVVGSGSLPFYDGAAFAREGVVLVTLNYRLGPLGFFSHPALSAEGQEARSGNYGLLDQIHALRWVRDNIRGFGGDPGNVTIFGESAGAVSVCWLLASPLAAGLFHRAIAESGTAARPETPDLRRAEAAGEAAAAKLGIEASGDAAAVRDALRAKTPAELQAALKPTIFKNEGMVFGPIVDGHLVPEEPAALFRSGKFNRVPLIVGTNSGDGSVFAPALPVKREAGFRLTLRALFRGHADAAARLYLAEGTDVEDAVRDLVTDMAFVAPARALARAVSAAGSKVWLYQFTRVAPLLARRTGESPHGAEIPCLFGVFPPVGYVEEDRTLGAAMRKAWVRFAATGDPNGGDLPSWPAYSAAADPHLEFGDRIAAGTGLRRAACDLLEEARPRLP